MSTEELVQQIQQGEGSMGDLWERVEGFVRWKALNWRADMAEDLYQSGYLALVQAVETFDRSKGGSFLRWFYIHLRNAFMWTTGHRGGKKRNDAMHCALPLDTPLNEAGQTAEEIVPDFAPSVEEEVERAELRRELEYALQKLSVTRADAVRQQYFHGKKGYGNLCSDAMKSLRRESVRQRLRKFL